MAIDARIRELGNRRQSLKEAIRQELSHPAADSEKLRDLKRRNLRLKEEIAGLSSRL